MIKIAAQLVPELSNTAHKLVTKNSRMYRKISFLKAGLLPFKKKMPFKRSAFKKARLRSTFSVQRPTAFNVQKKNPFTFC